MQKEGEKLKNQLKGAGIEINEVAKTLNMTRQNLGYHFRKDVLDRDFREKLFKSYANILQVENRKSNSPIGETNTHVVDNIDRTNSSKNQVSAPGKDYLKPAISDIITPDGIITNHHVNKRKSDALIPFYNADFMAGAAEMYYEDATIYPEYYMDVPEFYGCTAFRAYSDSMESKIRSGNILFGIKINDWRSHLEYGQIYGITCTDGRRYLKYIRKDKDDKHFLLKSENENYDDFTIPKSKINNIWLIEGWLDKRT